VAPEIIEFHPQYDVQCDIWSLGVVLYILLGGYRPFRGEGEDCMEKIRYGEYKFHQKYWSPVSDEAKILISRMLTVDPSRRITAEEALKSTWITMAEERSKPKKSAKGKPSSGTKARSKTGDSPANDRVPSDMKNSGKVSAAKDVFEKGNGKKQDKW
jgi:serine/threonine protein kinase